MCLSAGQGSKNLTLSWWSVQIGETSATAPVTAPSNESWLTPIMPIRWIIPHQSNCGCCILTIFTVQKIIKNKINQTVFSSENYEFFEDSESRGSCSLQMHDLQQNRRGFPHHLLPCHTWDSFFLFCCFRAWALWNVPSAFISLLCLRVCLYFVGGLEVSVSPSSEPLEEDDVVLQCKADKLIYDNLAWFRVSNISESEQIAPVQPCRSLMLHRKPLSHGVRSSPQDTNVTLELTLPNVSRQDEGLYACQVENIETQERTCLLRRLSLRSESNVLYV